MCVLFQQHLNVFLAFSSRVILTDCVDVQRYNNQWMVVDYKKFVAHSSSVGAGLLFVLEQIPLVTVVLYQLLLSH